MPAHAPLQVAPRQPEVRPAPPEKKPVAAPTPSNSAVQEQLNQTADGAPTTSQKNIGGVDGLASDNPLHTRQGGGRSTSGKKPGSTKLTEDPFGFGVQHTSEESQVTRKKKHHLAEKRRTERTHNAGQIVDGDLQLNRTTVRENTRGKKTSSRTETTHGAEIDFDKPLESKYTGSRSKTDASGKTTTNSMTVGPDGGSFTRSTEKNGKTSSFGVHGNPMEREVGIHGGVGKKFKGGNSVGLNGHVTAKLPGVSQGTVKAGDDSGLVHDEALRVSGEDELQYYGEDNALSLGLGVNAKLGVVGVQAHGHYANESSTNFYSTGGLSDEQLEKRGEEMIRTPEGDRASKLDDLNLLGREGEDGEKIAGLQPGEGVSMQSATSAGGGAGLSVYGVGAAGSYNNEQVQRTMVHRNEDGSTTFDITTADLNQGKGELQVGGGAAAAGYEANWGDASNINLTFEDNESGRAKMTEFVKTGVIPGAMGENDPERATYERLAAKEDLSKAERAQLASIADRVNGSYMEASAFEASGDQDGDVRIRTSKGSHEAGKVYSSVLGMETSASEKTTYDERTRYDENGINQVGDKGHRLQDNVVVAEENIRYDLNPEFGGDTRIEADARNWDGEHRNEFTNSGKTYPTFDSFFGGNETGEAGVWGDGKAGTTQASVDFSERDIATFQDKAKNLDLTSLTSTDRAAVEKEAKLRADANRPLTGDELASHLARQQAAADLEKIVPRDDPEFESIVAEQSERLLKDGSDAFLEGKTPEDLLRATEEIKAPLWEALAEGKANGMQHALAGIESGEDFTNAPYEVRRALLDRVVAGEAGTEDLKNVSYDNDTWQAALAMLSNGKGKTDRARVFHGLVQDDIRGGRGKGDTKSSSANRVLDTITHTIPDIGDLPQHDQGQDPEALQRFINRQISLKRQ